jgi:hypothetical protein
VYIREAWRRQAQRRVRGRPEARVDVRHLPIVCAARIHRLAVRARGWRQPRKVVVRTIRDRV